MAKSEVVRLPPIPDELTSAATDPTTKVIQTPDGRVQVHSTRAETEGHLDYQADGSFKYHSSTGSVVEFASNNHLMYQKGGFTLTVDNNGDIKMSGHGRVNFDHDTHIEVAKNASIVVNGLAEVHSTGHLKITAADLYLGSTKGSVVINAARNLEMTATKGTITQHSTGVHTITTDSGDFHVDTAGMIDMKSSMDTSIKSQAGITTQSQSDTNINSSGGNINTKGQHTNIQGPGNAATPTTFT